MGLPVAWGGWAGQVGVQLSCRPTNGAHASGALCAQGHRALNSGGIILKAEKTAARCPQTGSLLWDGRHENRFQRRASNKQNTIKIRLRTQMLNRSPRHIQPADASSLGRQAAKGACQEPPCSWGLGGSFSSHRDPRLLGVQAELPVSPTSSRAHLHLLPSGLMSSFLTVLPSTTPFPFYEMCFSIRPLPFCFLGVLTDAPK